MKYAKEEFDITIEPKPDSYLYLSEALCLLEKNKLGTIEKVVLVLFSSVMLIVLVSIFILFFNKKRQESLKESVEENSHYGDPTDSSFDDEDLQSEVVDFNAYYSKQ